MVEDNSGSDDNPEHSEKDIQNEIDAKDSAVPELPFPCTNDTDNDSKQENKENITDNIETTKPVDNDVKNTETEDGNSSLDKSSDQTNENPSQKDENLETTRDVLYDTKGNIIEYLTPLDYGHLDLRVGAVSYIFMHPNPSKDAQFKEQIIVGIKKDETLETYDIESGLPKQYKMSHLQYNNLVVLCNIKPVTRRGLENKVAVLCARKGEKTHLLYAPPEYEAGDPIIVEGYSPNSRKPFVSSVIKTLGSDLRVNKKRQVEYKGFPLRVKHSHGGFITTKLSDCAVDTVLQGLDI